MRKVGLLCLLFSFAFRLHALPEQKDSAVLLTKFHFIKYLSGIILIQLQIDNHPDTLTFVLDTGASGISLDSTTCERLHIESRLTDTFVVGVGGKKKVSFIFNRSLKLPGLTIDSLNLHINDYSFFSKYSNRKIDGIIGYNFLKRYIIAVDYENNFLSIYSPGEMTYPKKGWTFSPKVSPIPIIKATVIDSNRFNGAFFFDSGAKMELIVSKRFAEENHLFRSKRKMNLISVEGVAGAEYMPVSVVEKLTFGPYKFRNVPTYVFNDANNITVYPVNYGLIGAGIFSKFNLILNFPKGEVFMKPNGHFNAPFDYAYNGISIDIEDGKIIVYDVAPDSPAELYGLRAGDQIIAVDNIPYSDLDDCRDAINKRNTIIKIQITREGKMQSVLIKTGSFI
jgi:hypothetical protein